MEDVAAVQLLVAAGGDHLLPADDADAVAALQVLLGGVPEALIHIGGDPAVAQEVDHPVAEVAEGPIQVPQLDRKQQALDFDRTGLMLTPVTGRLVDKCISVITPRCTA